MRLSGLASALILTIFVKMPNAFSTVVDNDKPQLTSPSTENIEASASVRAVEGEGTLSHYLRGKAPSTLPTPSINPDAPDVAVNRLNPSNHGVRGNHRTGGVRATLDFDLTQAFVKDLHELKVLYENLSSAVRAKDKKTFQPLAQLLAKFEDSEEEQTARAANLIDSVLAISEEIGMITVSFPYTLFKLLDEKNVFHEIVLDDAKLKVWASLLEHAHGVK